MSCMIRGWSNRGTALCTGIRSSRWTQEARQRPMHMPSSWCALQSLDYYASLSHISRVYHNDLHLSHLKHQIRFVGNAVLILVSFLHFRPASPAAGPETFDVHAPADEAASDLQPASVDVQMFPANSCYQPLHSVKMSLVLGHAD